jgi:tRNA 2-thiouridine synthesizing protein A
MDDAATELDLRGLRCPLPALRTEKHLRGMTAGTRLAVLADDPLAAIDIPHLCQAGGHRLIETTATGGHRRFVIERAAASK